MSYHPAKFLCTAADTPRLALASFGLALALAFGAPASAQDGLVIDGETIADAELLNAAKAEGSLLYYTVNFEDMERGVLDYFKQDTGIDFEVVRLSTGRMFERVMTEHSGGKLEADLVSLTDFTLIEQLADAGVLIPYRIPNWDEIPDALKGPDGKFYTENRFAAVLGYNSARWPADEAPKSWAELTDPKFKGEIGIQQAGAGGMSWNVTLFQRKVLGDDYWAALAANDPRLYSSMSPLSDDLARGELTVGAVTVGLIRNLAQAGAPVGLHVPEEGAPAVPIMIGITSVAQHPNAAKLYVNWVMSRRGGKVITDVIADWASHPDVPPPDLSEYGITLPSSDKLWTANADDWVNLREPWVAEWDQIFRVNQ